MLKNVKYFNGVFMKDELRNKKLAHGFYIFNLDLSKNDGTHWTMCKYSEREGVEYFDSYGCPPPEELMIFFRQSNKEVRFNTTILQHLMSKSCGYFCVYMILEMNKGRSFYKVLMDFDIDDVLKNELFIKQYFKLK